VDPKRTPKPGPSPLRPQAAPAKPGLQRPGAPGVPGNAAPAPAPGRRPVPGIGEALDQLSNDIQKLRVDFERFFNGALPFPPDELRGRVQAQIRHLRTMSLQSAVDNFRLGDLEARFTSYNELFNRRVRDQEEGRHAAVRPVPPPQPKRYDPEKGIVFGERVDPEAAEALYQGLASSPGDAPRFDLDSFQTYLTRQVAAIREKTGCSQVQFRLAAEDGKLKLKARPVAAREGS
jgi:hypothetical protein